MSDDIVNIEVDGVPAEARKGQMIIEVTDACGAYVPRFCYHQKLTVAANCRMCLVEVEKAPKPLPACATPVAEGMKIFTKSEYARGAQRATMEFLLINHPLDCPICDQGGECELQDLAMGYGRDISRFAERKRVVKDKNIGPLISTDMTRCIHCTRCVRFTDEIAGYQELGTIGRAESMQIGTYIGKAVEHELSGNVIDLCPVGALNNKPFRFRARSWEMTQVPMVSPHDSTGTNLYGHVLRGKLMRVVPRDNEEINETWIADRDRYACYGIYSDDRLEVPMVKENGTWREAGWEEALETAASGYKNIPIGQIGMLASPNSTLEELHLMRQLANGLGSKNLDHRLRMQDFSDQNADPVYPWLGTDIAGIEALGAMLVIGSSLRNEAPMIAHRVRKAAIKGSKISVVNTVEDEYLFPIEGQLTVPEAALVSTLTDLLAVADSRRADETQKRILDSLKTSDNAVILLGHLMQRHSRYADLRALAARLAEKTGAHLAYLPDGGNAVGAALAGVLPHREAGGHSGSIRGLNVAQMLSRSLPAYLLLGIEPEYDTAAGREAIKNLRESGLVVAMTSFVTDTMRDYADVLLPIGSYAESAGTYVNAEGRWQSVRGAALPFAQSRPAWKVLRVLANLCGIERCDYQSSEEVRDELATALGEVIPDNTYRGDRVVQDRDSGSTISVDLYQVDPVVRRSASLQATRAENDEPEAVSF